MNLKTIITGIIFGLISTVSFAQDQSQDQSQAQSQDQNQAQGLNQEEANIPHFENFKYRAEALAIYRYVEAVSNELYEQYRIPRDKIFVLSKASRLEQLMDFFFPTTTAFVDSAPVKVAFLDGKDICFIYGDPLITCNAEEKEIVQSLQN